MLALKLDTDNCQTMEALRSDSVNLLDFCYKAIGCDCIEVVHPKRLPHPYVMIIDESGALKRLPVNPLMTDEGPDIVSLDNSDLSILVNIVNNAIKQWEV